MNLLSFYYIDSNIICIIILALLLARTIKGVDWQLSQVFFSKVLVFYILYFVIDIVWTCFDAGVLKNRLVFFLFYVSNYIVSSCCAFYWFIYSEIVQGNKKIIHKNIRRNYAYPLFIILALGVCFLIVLEFIYDYTLKGPFYYLYYLLTCVTPIFYVFASFFKSIKRLRHNEGGENSNMYIIMGLYPLIIFFGAIFQIVLKNVPIICYIIVIMLLCIYFRSLDNLISIDSLTKLNNRNQLHGYIERLSKENGNEKWLFFIDVDKFKSINDKYGHMEGDRALVLVSTSLKESCKSYPSRFFIARYGGDEFVIIANKKDINDCNELREKIDETLRRNVFNNGLDYNLSVSVGYSLVDFSKNTIEECLKMADEKLYVEKKAKRRKHINNVSSL